MALPPLAAFVTCAVTTAFVIDPARVVMAVVGAFCFSFVATLIKPLALRQRRWPLRAARIERERLWLANVDRAVLDRVDGVSRTPS